MNARRLAELEEQFETVPERQFVAERTLKAALASALRRAYQLELQVEELTAELRRLGAGSAASEPSRGQPSVDPAPVPVATS